MSWAGDDLTVVSRSAFRLFGIGASMGAVRYEVPVSTGGTTSLFDVAAISVCIAGEMSWTLEASARTVAGSGEAATDAE